MTKIQKVYYADDITLVEIQDDDNLYCFNLSFIKQIVLYENNQVILAENNEVYHKFFFGKNTDKAKEFYQELLKILTRGGMYNDL